MITIDNYDAILTVYEKERMVIPLGEDILFPTEAGILTYWCNGSYLSGRGFVNSKIFTVLGLNKDAFCRDVYGYIPKPGIFPECKSGDIKAILNIIRALFEECAKQCKPITKIELTPIQTKSFLIDLDS